MAVQTQIQVRRGTASSWTSTNPTLAAGEIGFESDTGKIKVGTGSATWNSLTYIGAANAIQYVYNASAGQTTFSGADANGATLAYTVGAEQVYVNGVLQVRGTDYTATNGTSVVLTTATIASDIVTVIAYGTFTVADTYTQAQANATFPLNSIDKSAGKNAIINSGFDIWQRGTSVAVSGASALTFAADRWGYFRGGYVTGMTVSRQATSDTTNLPFIQYAARVQRDSGNTSTQAIYFGQNIETANSIPFAGKTITYSFYARAGANYSSGSSGLTVNVLSGTGTDQSFIAALTGSATVISQNVTLTTTWQRFTITSAAVVSSSATQLVTYFNYTPVGTAGANDYFEITGVQLELGSVATAFARNASTIQGELAACQRYYWRSSNTSSYAPYGNGFANATNAATILVQLPVPMRTNPSSIEYSNICYYDGVTATAVSTPTIAQYTNAKITFYDSGISGLTQFRPYNLINNNNSAGYLGVNAEL